jgi:hypothetical protein
MPIAALFITCSFTHVGCRALALALVDDLRIQDAIVIF